MDYDFNSTLKPGYIAPDTATPDLASMKVCAQKFRTIRYFYILPQIVIGKTPWFHFGVFK